MESTKALVIKKLEESGDWIFSGKLARIIHELTGTKESVVERRARELVRAGVIERELVQVEGTGPRVVRLRIPKVEIPIIGIVDSKTEQIVFNQPELI